MIVLLAVGVAALIWRQAIRVSRRLSPWTWRTLVCVNVGLLLLSAWGLTPQPNTTAKPSPKTIAGYGEAEDWKSTSDNDVSFPEWGNWITSDEIDVYDDTSTSQILNRDGEIAWSGCAQITVAYRNAANRRDDLNLSVTYATFLAFVTGETSTTDFPRGDGLNVHLALANNGAKPLHRSPLRVFGRGSPTVQGTYSETASNQQNVIFWMSLFGMVISPISTILTLILTWISLHRRRAEAILLRLEVEKHRLEIEQLHLELERARREAARQEPRLLIVPG